jgi:hypothetical protein
VQNSLASLLGNPLAEYLASPLSPKPRSRLIFVKLEQSSLHTLSIPFHIFLDDFSRTRSGWGLSTSRRALSILKPSYRIHKVSFAMWYEKDDSASSSDNVIGKRADHATERITKRVLTSISKAAVFSQPPCHQKRVKTRKL